MYKERFIVFVRKTDETSRVIVYGIFTSRDKAHKAVKALRLKNPKLWYRIQAIRSIDKD